MSPGRTVAFHSYKGGTGKSTVVANMASIFANRGQRVALLDLDLSAPSLLTFFQKKPKAWINQLLTGEVEIAATLIDVSQDLKTKGRLFVALSSPRKEDIDAVEKTDQKWLLGALRRLLIAKEELFSKLGMDYIFVDSSPGIRFWSVNAMAGADIIVLMTKTSETDIDGTKRMIQDVYDLIAKFGSKVYILINKVPGAIPSHGGSSASIWENKFKEQLGTPVLGSIPCYCDVQFSNIDPVASIKVAEHPFSRSMEILATKIEALFEAGS